MAECPSKTTPKISNQENKENCESNEFGDFAEKPQKPATESVSPQKSVKLKRKKMPEVVLVKPEKQKIFEKRMKIENGDSKIPPIKLPESVTVDDGCKDKLVTSKPPLPPARKMAKATIAMQGKVKRKFEDENLHQIQKLSATNEQLRLEVTELKILLQNEKVVSRRLR